MSIGNDGPTKVGENFNMTLKDLARPLVGKIVELTSGVEKITARVLEVNESFAVLKRISDETKD